MNSGEVVGYLMGTEGTIYCLARAKQIPAIKVWVSVGGFRGQTSMYGSAESPGWLSLINFQNTN